MTERNERNERKERNQRNERNQPNQPKERTEQRQPSRAQRGHVSADPTAGLPLGPHSPYTPQGKLEQLQKISVGLGRLTGWRKLALRIVVGVVVLFIVMLLVANASRIR